MSPMEVRFSFQLTSSRRGWPAYGVRIAKLSHFNSHPHEEDDEDSFETGLAVNYFNSHPHEEDDSAYGVRIAKLSHFNSHPHEEDDQRMMKRKTRMMVFQLTSSRRGWPEPLNIEHDETIDFNSHPHEEDDADNYILYAVWENFNSHPHEEDDAKNRVCETFSVNS